MLSISEAKALNYSAFFEGLRTVHSDPLVLKAIHELQEKTKAVLKGSIEQEETWRAKLRYMGNLRAGWDGQDSLVSREAIKSAEILMNELDRFMDTTFIEFESDASGFLSLYWFKEDLKFAVAVSERGTYDVSKSSALTAKKKAHFQLDKNATLNKILKWSTK